MDITSLRWYPQRRGHAQALCFISNSVRISIPSGMARVSLRIFYFSSYEVALFLWEFWSWWDKMALLEDRKWHFIPRWIVPVSLKRTCQKSKKNNHKNDKGIKILPLDEDSWHVHQIEMIALVINCRIYNFVGLSLIEALLKKI